MAWVKSSPPVNGWRHNPCAPWGLVLRSQNSTPGGIIQQVEITQVPATGHVCSTPGGGAPGLCSSLIAEASLPVQGGDPS